MNQNDINSTISIKILDCEYKIKCQQEQLTALKTSASYLENKMKEVRNTTKIASIDRVAVITALNIAHELLAQQKQKNLYIDNIHRRIQDLQTKIEDVSLSE